MDKSTILDEIKSERGAVANIHSAFSEYPEGIKAHYDFYRAVVLGDGPLPREEREWLATETSIANECPYCYRHHTSAFEKNGGNQQFLSRRMELLGQLATTLTKSYWKAKILKDDFVAEGFTESEWQHATMIVSYFNFANRCAHAMDLEIESNFEESCK